MPIVAGTKLGPYEILAPLGAGGMGEVYRARDPRIGRDVAIKILPSSYSEDPDRLRRFELEARATGVLILIGKEKAAQPSGVPVSKFVNAGVFAVVLQSEKQNSFHQLLPNFENGNNCARAHDHIFE